MVQEIVFRVEASLMGTFDQPQPPISDLAGVILLQHGEATVGAWDAEICGFIHPSNQRELSANALVVVLESYPDADLKSADLRVFTCPESLVTQFNFGNWQSEWHRRTGCGP